MTQIKVNNTRNQNIENNDNVRLNQEDSELLSAVNAQFSEILSGKLNNNSINNENIIDLKNIDYTFDSMSMDFQDALFFINLAKEGQFSIETPQNANFQQIIQTEVTQNVVSRKSIEVTNQLTTLIEKAQSTQKPVRISFDNDVSVILKIDKHGKVTAEFIPGSVEVENYLRNNIASLKQKFDEQNLPYNELFYRQSNKQNRNRNKNKGE